MYREEKISIAVLSVLLSLGPFAHSTVGFNSARSYPVGTNPVAGKAADFNGDGKLDIAVVNSGSNDISILLGNGDGTFQPAQNFALANSQTLVPTDIALGDFNGDGKPDVAVFLPGNANSPSGEVRILMGNGDGTLQAPIVTMLDLQPGMGVAVTDVNGDKKADLLVSLFDSNNASNLTLNVLLGNGDGTFATPKVVVSGSQPLVAITDFNKDTKPDLGVIDTGGAQTLLGRGDGTFQIGVTVTGADGFDGSRIWVADVNGDGNMDLIVESELDVSHSGGAFSLTQHVSVYLAGQGTFGNQQILAQGSFGKSAFGFGGGSLVNDLVTGDFNGDGKVDIVDRRTISSSFHPSTTVLEIRLGNGDGTFAPNNQNLDPTLVLADPGSLWIAQDLNGNQLTDLVVSDTATPNAINVLLNATPAFSMSASEMALTAQAGQQVTDTLSLAAHNGFSSAIHLSCQVSGPAPLPTCSLSPADIPGGTNSSTSTLALDVPANSAGLVSPVRLRMLPLYALVFPFALLVISFRTNCTEASKRWLLQASLATLVFVCSACGGGNVSNRSLHQTKSYSVAVTAASATLTKTLQVAVTVT